VILNHTTILQVRSATARGGRIVTLDGEAFFRVRKTGSPFVVNTSAGSVEVLGTAFNVRVREAVLELTVAEGRVELHGPKGTLIVEAGQVASCPADGAPVLSDRRAGPDSPGWIHGRFTFEKASLASVCREFEETFDVHISIRSRDLPAHTVTGTVEAHTAETALATLARLTGTRIEHENGGYTLY
jgi:ferric-dicitrate binding protein FerR (iron transport regulator)